MLKRLATALCFVAAIAALVATARAQEGYPLTGTWYGDYGTGAQKKDVTLVMTWDGNKASGIMYPGQGSQPISSITMDIIPGKAGGRSLNNPDAEAAIPPVFNVKIVVGDLTLEGKMLNPVGGNRSIVGTYTKGAEKGPFSMKHL